MKIYLQEQKDGLENLILSKASVSFDSVVKPSLNLAIASKNKNRDLFGLDSILASVGWNCNDDVFCPIETWKARATPVNKKFNYMHDEKDIIGHTINAYVLDIDGNIIPDDTKEEDLPEFFEIGVGSVIYSIWEDKDLQARANSLMSEISEGKWFVSMEVLFPDFDYALSKGNEKVVLERNDETSFLTKHLRIYSGKGEYEGWKLGRKLKDMIFSGKGLVDNPANKRSLITSFNFNFNEAKASKNFNEVNMSVEQKDYDKSVADLAVAKNSLEASTKEIQTFKTQIENLTKDLEGAKALSVEKTSEIKELKTSLEAKDQKIVEVNKALAEVLEKAKNSSRFSELVSEGVSKEKAEDIVTKFAKASDEMFAEVVELHKNKKEVSKAEKVETETKKLDVTKAEVVEGVILQEIPEDQSNVLLETSKAFLSEYFVNKGKK